MIRESSVIVNDSDSFVVTCTKIIEVLLIIELIIHQKLLEALTTEHRQQLSWLFLAPNTSVENKFVGRNSICVEIKQKRQCHIANKFNTKKY